MRKSLLMALSLLFILSCGGEEPMPPSEPQWLTETRTMLVGSWHGDKYSETFNNTECEDIEFTPYDEPREIVSLFGAFDAYGIAMIEQYYLTEQSEDSLLKISKRCFYTFSQGDNIMMSFYECDEDDNVTDEEDKRIFRRISNTEFLMRKYGLTESNNKVYRKQ